MAKRKKSYDPNQFSLFDVPAPSPKEVREESLIPATPPENQELPTFAAAPEPSASPEEGNSPQLWEQPEAEVTDGSIFSEDEEPALPTEPVRLGINSDGDSVYIMPNGARMHSSNLGILQIEDGDRDSPDVLYVQNRHEFLTIQEVAQFKNETDLVVEVENVRQANRTSGNRPKRPQAGNDSGHPQGGYTSRGYSILDRWALNSPDELKKLEAQGKIAFDLKLYGQQQTEARALQSPVAQRMSQNGLSDWEILESLGVDTSLKITE